MSYFKANFKNANDDTDKYMIKENPEGSGSFSMNRKAGSKVGKNSSVLGENCIASGTASHSEGSGCEAKDSYTHAEGRDTHAENGQAHAEGYGTYAKGLCAHAEGCTTQANGHYTHSEGLNTTAGQSASHAEGESTTTWGQAAHAEGYSTYAQNKASHAEGIGTMALQDAQHAQGKYNIGDDTNTYAHIVGNGTSDASRSNAHTLDWNGNAWFAGDVTATDDNGDEVSLKETKPSKSATGRTISLKDSADLPLVDLKIYGHTVQNSTPTPDSPVEINGVGKNGGLVVNSYESKNLLEITATTQTIGEVVFTVNEDKSITVNGTASEDINLTIGTHLCLPGNKYVLSGCPSGGSVNTYCLYYENKGFLVDEGLSNINVVLSTESIYPVTVGIGITSGTTIDNLTFYPMMKLENVTDNTYEPYKGVKTNITLSTPLYDGDLLAKVDKNYKLYRKNAELILNGTEDWMCVTDDEYATTYGAYFKLVTTEIMRKGINGSNYFTSHFSKFSNPLSVSDNNTIYKENLDDGSSHILIRMNSCGTVDDFKNWLTSNNVKIVYEIEEPYYDEILVDEIKPLKTFEHNTFITNESNALMNVTYINQTYSDSLGMIFNNIPEGMTEEDVVNILKSNVVNNLTSTTTNLPLSAYQGKRLYDYMCDFLKEVSRATYVYHGQTNVSSGTCTYALPYAVHLPDHSRIYVSLELPYTDSSIKTDLGTVDKAIMWENEYNTNKLGSTVNGTGSTQGIIVGNGSTKWKITVEYNAYYIKISGIQRATNYSESYSTVSSGTLRVYSRIDWYICSLSSFIS